MLHRLRSISIAPHDFWVCPATERSQTRNTTNTLRLAFAHHWEARKKLCTLWFGCIIGVLCLTVIYNMRTPAIAELPYACAALGNDTYLIATFHSQCSWHTSRGPIFRAWHTSRGQISRWAVSSCGHHLGRHDKKYPCRSSCRGYKEASTQTV